MAPCLFCEIVAGHIPCDLVYQDDRFLAFRDIAPVAPVHILVIPRQHIAGLNDLRDDTADTATELLRVASHIARQEKLQESGYRCVINCGQDGGQTVAHLHLHLLGGRQLQWPPG